MGRLKNFFTWSKPRQTLLEDLALLYDGMPNTKLLLSAFRAAYANACPNDSYSWELIRACILGGAILEYSYIKNVDNIGSLWEKADSTKAGALLEVFVSTVSFWRVVLEAEPERNASQLIDELSVGLGDVVFMSDAKRLANELDLYHHQRLSLADGGSVAMRFLSVNFSATLQGISQFRHRIAVLTKLPETTDSASVPRPPVDQSSVVSGGIQLCQKCGIEVLLSA